MIEKRGLENSGVIHPTLLRKKPATGMSMTGIMNSGKLKEDRIINTVVKGRVFVGLSEPWPMR